MYLTHRESRRGVLWVCWWPHEPDGAASPGTEVHRHGVVAGQGRDHTGYGNLKNWCEIHVNTKPAKADITKCIVNWQASNSVASVFVWPCTNLPNLSIYFCFSCHTITSYYPFLQSLGWQVLTHLSNLSDMCSTCHCWPLLIRPHKVTMLVTYW